jgi:hypothetical protein
MLFDPKWEKKTPTLEGFITWLEQQKPDTQYDYWDFNACPIAQYLVTEGTTYVDFCQVNYDVLVEWNSHITSVKPKTFGDALIRARKYALTKIEVS